MTKRFGSEANEPPGYKDQRRTMKMPRLIDLAGRRFGRLTVLHRAPTNKRQIQWVCNCDCGNQTVVYGTHLRRQFTTSCGCYSVECTKLRNRTHGLTTNEGLRYLYQAYHKAIWRCTSPKYDFFAHYGGRGIKVNMTLEEWVMDLGPRPTSKHSVDRIDPDGHYEKGNIRWATQSEQVRNQRRSHKKPSFSVTLSLIENNGSL